MGEYVDYYYSDGRLKNLVDKILVLHYGWIPLRDYDDFYSIAGTTLWYCEEHYDKNRNKNFRCYFIDSLHRKFKTQLTKLNRKKRGGGVSEMSLDKFIDDTDDTTLGEMFAVKELPDIDILVQRYLDSLTVKQRQIAELMMKGYKKSDIKKMLNMPNEQYEVAVLNMKKDDKLEPLKRLRERMRYNDNK